MIKYTISQWVKFLGQSVILYGIRAGDFKFDPYLLHTTSHLNSHLLDLTY